MFRRWYDKEPTVSLAISLLKNAVQEDRERCAKYIITLCEESGATINYEGIKKLEYELKRWYDKERSIFDALEAYKLTSEESKKNIALKIIDFLQNPQ